MKKRTGSFFSQLKSNRGSGIITVLVTTLFIIALGTTLMFTAYTGYLVKISERGGKESFYSASTAMDEIKAQVQQAVTESLATAYTDVLSEYDTLSAQGDDAIQAQFVTGFQKDFLGWKTSDGSRPLFAAATGADSKPSYTYNAETLAHFLSGSSYSDSDSTYTVAFSDGGKAAVSGTGTVALVAGDEDSYIRLADITVSYTSADGYGSTVSSDIVVTMPDFTATTATVASSELHTYALVANNGLTVSAGSRTLTGSAYAGQITLNQNGTALTQTGGTLVSAGDVTVTGGAVFNTSTSSELWARNLTLGGTAASVNTTGTAVLKGKTYVANDLSLNGKASSATLSGSYYGFGASTDTSGASSAILVNGRDCALSLAGLDRLVLAGVGFVNTTGTDSASSIGTGESVSVRGNQLAYLVPTTLMGTITLTDTSGASKTIATTNPFVFPSNATLTEPAINTTRSLWGTGTKSLADYNASETKILKNTGTGYTMVYYFITFETQAQANAYFKDFFTHNPDKIAEYVEPYLKNLSEAADITRTAGNALSEDGDALTLTDASSADVSGRELQFSNRCQTLNPNKGSDTGSDTPYSYFVDTEKVSSVVNELTFALPETPSVVAARIKNGNYIINPGETAKVIIASGNVTVNSPFNGLILAGGAVTLNADVNSNSADVQNVLYNAETLSGTPLTDYLKNITSMASGAAAVTTSWDLDILVYYDSWAKS